MTAPIETTGAQTDAQPEAVLEGVEAKKIEGRSLGQIAWTRFKRDKVAVAGGIIVVLLILIAALSRPLQSMLGLDPNAFNQDLIDPNTSLPKGDFGGMSWDHPLGVEPKFGRDILARILEGSWVSLVVAFGATLLSNAIGVVLGLVAGYYGGRVDTIVSRLMDTFLAFPLLLSNVTVGSDSMPVTRAAALTRPTGPASPVLGAHHDWISDAAVTVRSMVLASPRSAMLPLACS